MAARRKSSKRKSSSKSKAARRKSPARKKTARKKASKKKATRKKVTKKKPTRKKVTKKKAPARKKAAGKKALPRKAAPKTSPVESLARKLIAGTRDPSKLKLDELYADGVISREPGREPAVGLAGMREKFSDWASMARSTIWKARNSFVKQNTICIEWEAEIELQDGRSVSFEEVAVHQVKGGKIVEERYYYDPAIFESAAGAEPGIGDPGDAQESSWEEPPMPKAPIAPPIAELEPDDPSTRHTSIAPLEDEPEEPDIDPMDL